MIFRAAQAAFARALRYLTPRDANPAERDRVAETLTLLVAEHGLVVDTYPTWHPPVPQKDPRHPQTIVSDRCGYTVMLVNAFLTCRYDSTKHSDHL